MNLGSPFVVRGLGLGEPIPLITSEPNPTNHEPRTTNHEHSGVGHLEVASVDGASAVIRAAARQPLKLITAQARGHLAWVYSTSFGGGLLAGDGIDLSVTVGTQARLLLATQASTKIYRSDNGKTSSQHCTATVGAHGLLLNLPEPVTPFAGSRFDQTQRIAADPSAGVCWIDGLTAGRTARDESWNFAAYSSRLELVIGDQRRWLDRVVLGAGQRSAAARLRPWNALVTVLVGGAPLADLARSLLDTIASRPVIHGSPLLISASAIPGWGVALRGSALAYEQLDHELRSLLAPLATITGENPWQRRL